LTDTVQLNDLASEITTLSQIWYELVNVDHHKDRDCHWHIDVSWSYGDGPVFTMYHEGYIYERVSRKFRNMNSAMRFLRDTIKDAIANQREWAQEVLDAADPEEHWSNEEATAILKILERAEIDDRGD
jgi:(2Fe-2S) ferredoxin